MGMANLKNLGKLLTVRRRDFFPPPLFLKFFSHGERQFLAKLTDFIKIFGKLQVIS